MLELGDELARAARRAPRGRAASACERRLRLGPRGGQPGGAALGLAGGAGLLADLVGLARRAADRTSADVAERSPGRGLELAEACRRVDAAAVSEDNVFLAAAEHDRAGLLEPAHDRHHPALGLLDVALALRRLELHLLDAASARRARTCCRGSGP